MIRVQLELSLTFNTVERIAASGREKILCSGKISISKLKLDRSQCCFVLKINELLKNDIKLQFHPPNLLIQGI